MKQNVHAYPRELVSFIFDLWQDPSFVDRLLAIGMDPLFELPDPSILEQIFSTCYQASLMREEERTVMFRLIMGDPEVFQDDSGPPTGLHRLYFTNPRPFNEAELHRLAPAADFRRTLIGIRLDEKNILQIWGLVHSGTRWMQTVRGGRKTFPSLPLCLVIYATSPGRLSVCLGPEMIASLNNGRVTSPYPDVFTANWLAESFADVRLEMRNLHEAARAQAGKPWAIINSEFGRDIAQQASRRIISEIRNSRHGGMLVYLPPDAARCLSKQNSLIAVKYPFREDEPRQRFRTLLLRIMNTLAKMYGDPKDPERIIGWQEYVTCRSEAISLLDEAFFDLAHFVAALSATDGAVVMTKRGEILGFGGLISGDINQVGAVNRALDIEGTLTELEPIEGVGTRHRAAYRLCQELHDALVVVISQDGTVRIVKWHNGGVTYWDQAPTGVPGF